MANIETIDRAQPRPSSAAREIRDEATRSVMEKALGDTGRIAQELTNLHNMIQSGEIAVAAGLTTITVPIRTMPFTNYVVVATVSTFNGWVAYAQVTTASRTTTSFGLTFSAAAPAGAGGIANWHLIG